MERDVECVEARALRGETVTVLAPRTALRGRPGDLGDAEQPREGEVVEPGPGRDRLGPERRLHAGDVALPHTVDERRRLPLVRVADARRPRPAEAELRGARVLHVEVRLVRGRH